MTIEYMPLTFGIISRYFIAGECLLLAMLLFIFRSAVHRVYFASVFTILLCAVGSVCLASAVDFQVHLDAVSGTPLKAAVPAMISVATVALCAVCGALLHPSPRAAVPCLCGSVTVHPRSLWLAFGLGLFLCNALTVSALESAGPLTLIAVYFACPALLAVIVVLSLRVVVSRTYDSKVGSIAMLGGSGVVAVGVAAVAVLHLTYGCGWISAGAPSDTCPLSRSFDAGAVVDCFLAVGLLIVFIGAQKIACERFDQLQPVVGERKGVLIADGTRVSRYMRVEINAASPLLSSSAPSPLPPAAQSP